MTAQEQYEKVTRWYSTGHLSESDRQALRSDYLSEQNITQGCTTCPGFWLEMQHYYRYKFKQLGFTPMQSNRKYMIREDAGHLRLFGSQKLIVNEGEENENTTVLTDKMAEELLKDNDNYKDIIVKNPAYDEAAAAKTSSPKTATPASTPKATTAPKASTGAKKSGKGKAAAAKEEPATEVAETAAAESQTDTSANGTE